MPQRLFPELEADRAQALRLAGIVEGLVEYATGCKPFCVTTSCRQRVLLSGLDCLRGQQDLFKTDGESQDASHGQIPPAPPL